MTTTTITAPPSPLDDPTVSNPLECPALRWGILSCGRVSHDFCQALKLLPTASVVACAAKDNPSRAAAFATKHGIATAYDNYDDLVHDESVQIVYVGNVHAFRKADGEKCLLANKHVLLEKPFALSADDARYLVNLASERKLFLMEGMWTRFFPAVERARKLVLEDRVLGDVVSVYSDFNFNAADNADAYPDSILFSRELAGGATMFTAPYPVTAATLFFGSRPPETVRAAGPVDEATGVDLQAAVILSFAATAGAVQPASDDTNHDENTPKLPGSGLACLSYGMLGESEETTTVVGTKGRLVICSPSHCPTKLSVTLKGKGRGVTEQTAEYEFPLPADTATIAAAGGYVYPNSAGFCYEAAAVARCVEAGKIETPQYTLRETVTCATILDDIKQQLGVQFFSK